MPIKIPPKQIGRDYGAKERNLTHHFFTTSFTLFEVLDTKFKSPPYTASTDDVPSGNDEVVKLASPPLNVPVPSTVVPFMKLTDSPSGGAPVLELTVAVKVTASPEMEGFGEAVRVVVVPSPDGFISNTAP
jgi:hypothetical protein